MLENWELCISYQNNVYRFALCRPNKKKKRIEVSKAFQLNLPDDYDSNNDPDGSIVSELIRNALKENHIKNKKYSFCISDRDIITRVIKLPKMDMKSLKSFLMQSIHQYFPIKGHEYCFDYRVQSINEDDEKGYYNLFLVAIPKSTIEYHSHILLKAGLRPKHFSIYSDAVFSLFSNFVDKDIAIMDISYNHTEFIMLDCNSIFINSVINYNLPKGNGIIDEDSYLKNLGEEDLGEDFEVAFETLGNYIEFFSSRHHGRAIEEIFFVGEGSKLNILPILEKNLNIPISDGGELFKNKIVTVAMNPSMREKYHPERYYSCFGLIAGGLGK